MAEGFANNYEYFNEGYDEGFNAGEGVGEGMEKEEWRR